MIGLRNRRRVGAGVWAVGVAIAVVWAGITHQRTVPVPGLGQGRSVLIASEVDGRIQRLEVDLHDAVEAGAPVVHMSDTRLRVEREVAAAEFLALSAAPAANPDDLIERARDEARVRQVSAEFAALEARIRSLRSLLASGAASQAELDGALARRQVLQLKLERAQPDAVEEGTSPWSVVAALRRLDAVDARLASLTVHSTLQGQVSVVHHREGEVVRRGDPVLTVEETTSAEVIAWVTPKAVPTPGTAAVVQRSDGTTLNGEVVSVSPGTGVLPEQIWTIPGRPQYGISVRVKLDGATVRPREPVRVYL